MSRDEARISAPSLPMSPPGGLPSGGPLPDDAPPQPDPDEDPDLSPTGPREPCPINGPGTSEPVEPALEPDDLPGNPTDPDTCY